MLVDLPGIGDSNAARDKIAKNVRKDALVSFHTSTSLSMLVSAPDILSVTSNPSSSLVLL